MQYNTLEGIKGGIVMERKMCILEDDKVCDDCGQCNMCDLNPEKVCDNCMECLHSGADYTAIEIDEIIDDSDSEDA